MRLNTGLNVNPHQLNFVNANPHQLNSVNVNHVNNMMNIESEETFKRRLKFGIQL